MNPLDNLPRKQKRRQKITEPRDYPEMQHAAPASEMTGLMHKPPESEAELESYEGLAGMPAKKRGKK